ncbi:hypothetical protein KAT36_02140 [Candidatus Pacearchaeota archaeon]|nr:hypothetical protein [Candidatus Pacearchaeota archaeon]
MNFEIIVYSVLALIFSIIILWVTSLSMIRDKNIFGYLAFFALGIVLVVHSTFMVFEFFWGWQWVILELLIFFNLIWILMEMGGFNK